MNSKLIILFLGILSFQLQAQTAKLHAIIFAATDEPLVGEGCQKNFDRMTGLAREIAENADLKLHPYYFSGEECTTENLLEAVKNLKCDKEDAVFFYYTGHGISNPDSPYPDLKITSQSTLVNLKEVDNKIAKKKPKNQIIIGECCNRENDFLAFDNISSRNTMKFRDRYKDLFKTEGRVLVCASEKGNATYVNPEEGGIFLNVFQKSMDELLAKPETATWNQLLFKVDLELSGLDIRINGKVQSPNPTPYYEGYQVVKNAKEELVMVGK